MTTNNLFSQEDEAGAQRAVDKRNFFNRTATERSISWPGRGQECGRKQRRMGRRGSAGSNSGRADVLDPADHQVGDSVCQALSILGGEMPEETVEGLKQNIKEVAQENTEMKKNVLKLEGDVLEKKKFMKAMMLHVEHWRSKERNLLRIMIEFVSPRKR